MDQTGNQVVSCNSSVVDSTTLLASPSHPNKILQAKKIPVVGKIPVVISEADVQIYLDATIQLEEDALDITKVTKNVVLTRCQLLLTDDKKSSKVLLSGYVRKNIEYSIPKSVNNDAIRGAIHFTVVNIPFKCFAKVDFITEPVTAVNPQMVTSFSAAANGMGVDPSSVNSMNSEILNDKIFVELIQTKIRDIDVKRGHGNFYNATENGSTERTFRTFSDSMVVELKLRVIQNQSVEIAFLNGGAGAAGGGQGANGGGEGANGGGQGANGGGQGANDGGKGDGQQASGGNEGNSGNSGGGGNQAAAEGNTAEAKSGGSEASSEKSQEGQTKEAAASKDEGKKDESKDGGEKASKDNGKEKKDDKNSKGKGK